MRPKPRLGDLDRDAEEVELEPLEREPDELDELELELDEEPDRLLEPLELELVTMIPAGTAV